MSRHGRLCSDRAFMSLAYQPLMCAAAYMALSVTAPATAQQSWGVSDTPQSIANDSVEYCALWYGRTPPMLQLQLLHHRATFILAADEFEDVQDGAKAQLDFPSGVRATIPTMRVENAIMSPLAHAAMDGVLDNLSTPGPFRVTIEGQTVGFSVPELSNAINILRECESQIDVP